MSCPPHSNALNPRQGLSSIASFVLTITVLRPHITGPFSDRADTPLRKQQSPATSSCRLGKYSEAQLGALSSIYTHFQTATMDFVQLMDINFPEATRCKCENPCGDLTLDGTTISCQIENLCIVQPWGAPHDETDLTRGSAFVDRLLVREPDTRALLRAFTVAPDKSGKGATGKGATGKGAMGKGTTGKGTTGKGVPKQTLAAAVKKYPGLAAIVNAAAERARPAPDPSASAVLDTEGAHLCAQWARRLLRALGSDAPACTLIPSSARHLVEHYIAHGKWGSQADALKAAQTLPLVYDVYAHLRDHPSWPERDDDDDDDDALQAAMQGTTPCDNFKNVLRQLLEVRVLTKDSIAIRLAVLLSIAPPGPAPSVQ